MKVIGLILFLRISLLKQYVGQSVLTRCLESKEFTLIDQPLTFEEAKASCEYRGMKLAALTNQDEIDFVAELANELTGFSQFEDIWIGKYVLECLIQPQMS